jgi:hypothetical protein
MPEMTPLSSSNIAAAGWDEDTRTLTVEFSSGSTYTYSGVPRDVYEGLLSAPSAGSFFARQIRGRYSYQGG